ncbi:MAG: cytochrome c3 family protein, partial [Acidobacteriaceae bacterium]|nr:cytochrome c3 family protein [Acidobacteriaceae bacterium]
MRRLVTIFSVVPFFCFGVENGYLGRDVCAGCHKAIAATQSQTAMAQTWQGTTLKQIAPGSSETRQEGPEPAIDYLIRRTAGALSFQVQMPAQAPVQFPVEIVMGGRRHGLSFLARVHDLNGSALQRDPLIETRYLHYAPENKLALSPGFPRDKPTTYETALGRVLTPQFEQKCLACHGEPRAHGTHIETGVSCESCHGPGRSHLTALTNKSADKGILNPRKLPVADQMQPCSQCHAGFSKVQDPMPDDLLISDQVTALSNSECWRQSGGRITCVNCHNPHSDLASATLVQKSEKTCVGCHNTNTADHPALCPVNRTRACVGCHMPDGQTSAPFIISDHWIRVHPEQNVPVPPEAPEWRSKTIPKHLFLRLIVLDNAAKAASVRQELVSGASFFDLARANSLDRGTAINGGFAGDLAANELDAAWASAALALRPGENSPVIENGGKYFILGRMPRNFRDEAEARFNQAMDLR